MKWLLAFILLIQVNPARSAAIVVGFNAVYAMRSSPEQRAALLLQLAQAGVTAIRAPLSNASGTVTDQAIAYAKQLSDRGIGLDLTLGVKYRADAPVRPAMPDRFPQMYSGAPLSAADPDASEAYYREIFNRLDAAGVKLISVELGNEINWAGFNPEFPLPGEGRVFDLSDLASDPEAKQIAQGYLQYLKILERLKKVRDQSRLNHTTPILSAGLADIPPAFAARRQVDAVSIGATIGFLRGHGLDDLVDGYGVHAYPSARAPGDPAADQQRLDQLRQDVFAACRKGDPGHACWLTEWGFPNRDVSCPPDETLRVALVRQFRQTIADLSSQYRIGGIFYFSWDSRPWVKSPDPDSVFRCGSLTDAGKAAIQP